MPLADYMRLALTHPQYGYYITHDPIGAAGDFITAPEISQMFGELIGVWMVAVWQQMGSPENVRVIELGPGHGTLIIDALRASKIAKDFHAALVLHLVEISPRLKGQQQQRLETLGLPMLWHTALSDVPPGPNIIVANEFIDALPVHQAIKQADGWRYSVRPAVRYRKGLCATNPPYLSWMTTREPCALVLADRAGRVAGPRVSFRGGVPRIVPLRRRRMSGARRPHAGDERAGTPAASGARGDRIADHLPYRLRRRAQLARRSRRGHSSSWKSRCRKKSFSTACGRLWPGRGTETGTLGRRNCRLLEPAHPLRKRGVGVADFRQESQRDRGPQKRHNPNDLEAPRKHPAENGGRKRRATGADRRAAARRAVAGTPPLQ